MNRFSFVRIAVTALLLATCTLANGGRNAAGAAEFDAGKLAAIRARMQAFVDQRQLSGAVTVVGNEKGIVGFEAVGMANISQNRPMAPDTLFRIASMTKPITALGIMILVDEGKIKVDEPVEKYLPEFKGQMQVASKQDGMLTLKKPARLITVRDLLTHTSGLPGGFPPGASDLYGRRHLSLAEAVLLSSQQPLDFDPGSKWAYCNAGIDTLGRIIEVAAAEPFESFMARRIFQPLGMKDTFFYPPADRLPRVAAMYDVKDGQLVEPTNVLIGPPQSARHPIPARWTLLNRRRSRSTVSNDATARRIGWRQDCHSRIGRHHDSSADRRLGMWICARHEFRLRLGRGARTEGCDRDAQRGRLRTRRRLRHSRLDRSTEGVVCHSADPASGAKEWRRLGHAPRASAAGSGSGSLM
jgi:CubicO group peptidase (beta-lactamase class C family)